jgi:uncharacterized membrane protein YdbT with pleckstrin-like domain
VAFPDDVLTEDESVELHLHPHWKALVRPTLALLVGIAALVAGWIYLPTGEGGTIAMYAVAVVVLVVVLRFAVWPYLTWRTTHYVFTNERVLLQRGVLARDRHDIPLSRVNDHAMTQRFGERLLGCGTLTIESVGELGRSVLTSVPRVQRVQTTLYELVDAYEDEYDDYEDEDDDSAYEDARPRRRWLGRR